MADLEAELDDPFADGEWEELSGAEAAEAREAKETTAAPEKSPAVSHPARQANSSEATQPTVEAPKEDSDPEQSVPSDGEMAEASDGLEVDHGIAISMGNIHVQDPPSPPSSSSSQPQLSNTTVQPVDIIGRKPVPNGTSSRLTEPNSHAERQLTRTPSPNGLHPSSIDAIAGVEGPMTPRNDAGPFIFDGSAGRVAGMRLANVASMNLDEAADSPIPPNTPQAAAEP